MSIGKIGTFDRAVSMILSLLMVFAACAVVMASPVNAAAADDGPLKKRATYYTDEEVANVRENANGYYASTKTAYVNAAEKYR